MGKSIGGELLGVCKSIQLSSRERNEPMNVTVNASFSINPNRSSAAVMNTSASIISKITGATKTENNTYFVEFKTGALKWSPDLTNEYHNTFINSANGIVKTFPDDGETDPLELVFQTLLVCFGLLTIDVVEKQPTFASRPLVKNTAAQMSEMSAVNNTSNKNLLIFCQGSTKTIQSLNSFPGPVGLMHSYTLLEDQMSLAFVASCGLPPVKIEVRPSKIPSECPCSVPLDLPRSAWPTVAHHRTYSDALNSATIQLLGSF
ncbi:hypothetical protein AWC38_SpisGene9199 [Stylophora pistillata]|uniref:Uncharacterized protein n=1 Tax=Stylophora pistillata TaxID=50429 RepID=A0A2B4SBD3_STYPI|nr:hypothetical protein AWC38_SpisGene9199 [Stylophora pistillata]